MLSISVGRPRSTSCSIEERFSAVARHTCSTRADRIGERQRQTACFGHRGCLLGQRRQQRSPVGVRQQFAVPDPQQRRERIDGRVDQRLAPGNRLDLLGLKRCVAWASKPACCSSRTNRCHARRRRRGLRRSASGRARRGAPARVPAPSPLRRSRRWCSAPSPTAAASLLPLSSPFCRLTARPPLRPSAPDGHGCAAHGSRRAPSGSSSRPGSPGRPAARLRDRPLHFTRACHVRSPSSTQMPSRADGRQRLRPGAQHPDLGVRCQVCREQAAQRPGTQDDNPHGYPLSGSISRIHSSQAASSMLKVCSAAGKRRSVTSSR